MYVRACWYVAAWENEIAREGLLARKILNESIVFLRKGDGSIAALEDRCCHRSAPLSLGHREGDALRCGYHGLKFDCEGKCIEIPGQSRIPDAMRVKTYPAVLKHSWLWVWMGAPGNADVTLIPPVVGYDDPAYVLRGGQWDCAANYELINDNLCDFSHVSFVHSNSFRVLEYSQVLPRITRLERGIRVERWLSNSPHRPDWMAAGDTWQTYDYLAPGVLLMYSALYPEGTAARCSGSPDQLEPLHANFSSQAITPVTDRLSRYFYSIGPRSSESDALESAERIFAGVEQAFLEDKMMIEAQQRTIDSQGLKVTPIRNDRGPAQMRRVLERLHKEENAPGA